MISREVVGAFIDAIYAIAITILALEVPGDLGEDFLGGLLVYAITFAVLLAFWIQHRRINSCVDDYDRVRLWLTGGALLMVCLMPRATTLIFEHGGDVTIDQIEASLFHGAGWSAAEVVDIFYVVVVLAADACLLLLTRVALRGVDTAHASEVRQAKIVITVLLIVITSLSLLTPIPNRYFMAALPFALFFERELLMVFARRQQTDREP